MERFENVMKKVLDRILVHPFFEQLCDGSLAPEVFVEYIRQDALYLVEYSRCLMALAARAPDADCLQMLSTHALDAVNAERGLHQMLLETMGDAAAVGAGLGAPAMSPCCTAYTSYLLVVCHNRPFHEGLAAVLPCYWIYLQVGLALAKRGSPHPAYRTWIENYGSAEFAGSVRAVCAQLEAILAALSAPQVERMLHHVTLCSKYEWMFWDAAFKREAWPEALELTVQQKN